MDGIQIELQVMQKDPFFLLNYDEEFRSKTSEVQTFFNKNSDFLGIHISWLPNEIISSMTKNEILKIITDVSRTNPVDLIDVPLYKLNRCKFLLASHLSAEYLVNKNDLLLKISRTVMTYRFKKSVSNIEQRKVFARVANLIE